ncbi:recombinase family protein [Micromonospora orduensis]|uniref:recombinase family protein n=1 Tax=Micromonospora orduensis TaxID=1420891 RepID=UPI00142F1F8E|nr:recombinase family protein [Micromonospora orduensis]
MIGYVRVSTEEQSRHGHGLRAGIDYLSRYSEANGWDLVTVMMDVVSTRRTARMLGRAATITAVEMGAADAMLIRAIDRVTRSVKDGADLQAECRDAGVRLLSCDGYDSADEETQLTANIKIAVAQEERRLISRRTREGLARARAEGKRLGRQSTVPEEVAARIVELRRAGETYAGIATKLDADNVETPGGSPRWRPAAVRAIYQRSAEVES